MEIRRCRHCEGPTEHPGHTLKLLGISMAGLFSAGVQVRRNTYQTKAKDLTQ